MNKKGFTLIELLAVIALLSVIVVFAVPNVIKVFNENKNSLSRVQKNQLKSATEMYINDYCTEPIGDEYVCGFSTKINSSTGLIEVTSGRTITINTLVTTGYFDDQTIINNCGSDSVISITSSGEIDLSGITCNFNN